MVRGGMTGRIGLFFAALSGAGAASVVSALLQGLPMAPALVAQYPYALVMASLPIGAVVAIAHIFWLRTTLSKGRPAASSRPADMSAPARTLVPPPSADGEEAPRWRPIVRD